MQTRVKRNKDFHIAQERLKDREMLIEWFNSPDVSVRLRIFGDYDLIRLFVSLGTQKGIQQSTA